MCGWSCLLFQGNGYRWSGDASVLIFCLHSEKASILKVKMWEQIPFRIDPFSERGWCAEKQTEIPNFVIHLNMADILSNSVFSPIVFMVKQFNEFVLYHFISFFLAKEYTILYSRKFIMQYISNSWTWIKVRTNSSRKHAGLVGEGNLGVILVRVCEPVFQNLPHSYTWPSKKRIHSYTWSSKMLTYSYTALWFLNPFLLVI